MKEDLEKREMIEGKPDSYWYRVYTAVFIFMVFVISALAYFSWHFSK